MIHTQQAGRFVFSIGFVFALGECLFGNDISKLPVASRESIESAVVWIEGSRGPFESFLGTGVCVGDDGHVVFRSTNHLQVQTVRAGDKLVLHFRNGNETTAKVLGWSDAWKIAVAKIDSGSWPHIAIRETPINKNGEACFAAEFNYVNEKFPLSLAQGNVTRVESTWFASNIAIDSFPPIFDLSGTLIGVTTSLPLGSDSNQTHVSIITKLLRELSNCENIDKEQAFREAMTFRTNLAPNEDVREIVRNTSVLIRPVEQPPSGNSGWTGTSIGSGLVATCGHISLSNGTKVTIRFANGRIANGVTLGLNPIVDVGLVRISDEGHWPVAQIATSTELKAGDSCFFAGYPGAKDKLVEVEAKFEEPKRQREPKTYIWGHTFYTDGSFKTLAGMSGSGIFNHKGFLVGVHSGTNTGQPSRHVRIEFLTEHFHEFLDPVVTPSR